MISLNTLNLSTLVGAKDIDHKVLLYLEDVLEVGPSWRLSLICLHAFVSCQVHRAGTDDSSGSTSVKTVLAHAEETRTNLLDVPVLLYCRIVDRKV